MPDDLKTPLEAGISHGGASGKVAETHSLIAAREAHYWANLEPSDDPFIQGVHYGAIGAAANICGAIALDRPGKTGEMVTEEQVQEELVRLRKMAAGPELYEALEQALPAIDAERAWHYGRIRETDDVYYQHAAQYQKVLDKAAAALAKARGGTEGRVLEPFDVGDGINRYRPCPQCLSDSGMGLVSEDRALAVQCTRCGFRGPALKGSPSWQQDKWAFDAWNDLPRETERLAALQQENLKLCDALEAVLQSAFPNEKEHPTMCAAWKIARAALAKARGEGR